MFHRHVALIRLMLLVLSQAFLNLLEELGQVGPFSLAQRSDPLRLCPVNGATHFLGHSSAGLCEVDEHHAPIRRMRFATY